jgi:EAL domain-containing protein (putative c-di-GMP-specific phosphodiesterase class I)
MTVAARVRASRTPTATRKRTPPRAAVLDQLASLAQEVAAADDLTGIYRALYHFALATSPSNGIFVSLYDPVRKERTCVYAAGDGAEDDVSGLPHLPMTGSPQSRAIETAEVVVVDDWDAALAGKPVVPVGAERDPRMTKSGLAVPMTVLGRVIGAFEVQSLEPAAYTDDHVVAMRLAASLAAIATENVLRPSEDVSEADATARARIETIIRERAFGTVFQPIVQLDSMVVVGYEALSRFHDGTPPDLCFSEAARVGRGLELEAAAVEAALIACEPLPANVWLNVNVSPALVVAGEPLASIVQARGWQLILELTEHTAIADYAALRAAVERLGPGVRLAIDDAGAGYASFRHIVELGPAFVKIDRSLVSGVSEDPARQALVAGLRHFALQVDCTLIAEGIERPEELRMLRSLGIPLGQGYHLGMPMPAEEAARAAVRPIGSTPEPSVPSARRPTGRVVRLKR